MPGVPFPYDTWPIRRESTNDEPSYHHQITVTGTLSALHTDS